MVMMTMGPPSTLTHAKLLASRTRPDIASFLMDMDSKQKPRLWYCCPLVVQGMVAAWPPGT
eukprot:176930-Karenia_brevis.AAC.1